MKAYSLDLREHVAAACQQPGRTIGAVAAQFNVSVSFVEKLLQRTSGSLAPLLLRDGPAPCLDASSRADLVACLRQQPDATLDELRVWAAALGGPAVSPATMDRAVQAVNWRRKQERPRRGTQRRAGEGLAGGPSQSPANRGRHLFQVRGRNEHESDLLPHYARAEGGQRAH